MNKKIGLVLVALGIIGSTVSIYFMKDNNKAPKEEVKTTQESSKEVVEQKVEQVQNAIITEEKKVEIKSEIQNPVPSTVAKDTLSKFVTYVNSKQIDKAYEMLDQDYAKDFSLSKDIFTSKYTFDKEVTFDIVKLNSYDINKVHVAWVEIKEKGEDKRFIEKKFSIYEKNGQMVLADLDILERYTITGKTKVMDNLEATVSAKYLTEEGTVFIFKLNNFKKEGIELVGGLYSFFAKANGGSYNYFDLGQSPISGTRISPFNNYYQLLFRTKNVEEVYVGIKAADGTSDPKLIYKQD